MKDPVLDILKAETIARNQSPMKLCIYHGNCFDGFGAAWAVREAFGKEVEFHAGEYGAPPPDVTDRDVIIVDFSYKRDVLEEMAKTANTILILDHHKTALEDLAHAYPTPPARRDLYNPVKFGKRTVGGDCPIFATLDMNYSGAILAWAYFHPDKICPQLLLHIEDRDLWRFDLSGTREIIAFLGSLPFDFEVWDDYMDPSHLEAQIGYGAILMKNQIKQITEFLEINSRLIEIDGHEVPVANVPRVWSSEAGHILCKGHPFSATYYDSPTARIYSLRSEDGALDVSKIASRLGGRGDEHAAGFEVPLEEILHGE